MATADFFNANRLDALVTGMRGDNLPTIQFSQNLSGGNFVPVANSGLQAIDNGIFAVGYDVAVGDFNNDGRRDVFMLGNGASNGVIQLCLNIGNGTFVATSSGITASGNGAGQLPVIAADFDNDGWTDILVGRVVWHNQGNGSFSNLVSGLPGPVLAVGDFDNDGYLDALVANGNFQTGTYQVWRNVGNGTFTNTGAILSGLPGAGGFPAVAAVGDYDNDGKLDILLVTGQFSTPEVQVWRNLGNGLFSNTLSIAGSTEGTLTWGDFNGDSRLDFIMTGQQGQDTNDHPIYVAQLWLNTLSNSNSPPTAPANLTARVIGNGVKLVWGAATDDHTPASGLNYNIRVGSSPGGVDIVSPEADVVSGRRLVVDIGNAQERLFSLLTNLSCGTYYWSVQAIDTAFAGGAFAAESVFVIPPSVGTFGLGSNGEFRVGFNGLASNSYSLQGSTDLAGWTNLVSVLAVSNGVVQLADTNAGSFGRRFYRLRTP